MRKVFITPEAYNDLENLKDYLDFEFGVDKEKIILEAIFRDLNRLEKYPETDIKLFERFGIITDYKCLYTQKNYALRTAFAVLFLFRFFINNRFAVPLFLIPVVHDYQASDAFVRGGSHIDAGYA